MNFLHFHMDGYKIICISHLRPVCLRLTLSSNLTSETHLWLKNSRIKGWDFRLKIHAGGNFHRFLDAKAPIRNKLGLRLGQTQILTLTLTSHTHTHFDFDFYFTQTLWLDFTHTHTKHTQRQQTHNTHTIQRHTQQTDKTHTHTHTHTQHTHNTHTTDTQHTHTTHNFFLLINLLVRLNLCCWKAAV